MRRSRDQLVFRALAVLDEAVADCRDTPLKPTLGQRFALMFLYTVSDGDRHAYDDFWQAVQDPQRRAHSDSMGGAMRETSARTCLTGIARSVGIAFSADYQRELRISRMPPGQRIRLREQEARLAEHCRRLHEDGWQYAAEDRARAQGEEGDA